MVLNGDPLGEYFAELAAELRAKGIDPGTYTAGAIPRPVGCRRPRRSSASSPRSAAALRRRRDRQVARWTAATAALTL